MRDRLLFSKGFLTTLYVSPGSLESGMFMVPDYQRPIGKRGLQVAEFLASGGEVASTITLYHTEEGQFEIIDGYARISGASLTQRGYDFAARIFDTGTVTYDERRNLFALEGMVAKPIQTRDLLHSYREESRLYRIAREHYPHLPISAKHSGSGFNWAGLVSAMLGNKPQSKSASLTKWLETDVEAIYECLKACEWLMPLIAQKYGFTGSRAIAMSIEARRSNSNIPEKEWSDLGKKFATLPSPILSELQDGIQRRMPAKTQYAFLQAANYRSKPGSYIYGFNLFDEKRDTE